MRFVKFMDKDGSEIEINPEQVSFIYSSGSHTGIVFAGRTGNPLILHMPRDVVRRRLLGEHIPKPQTGSQP